MDTLTHLRSRLATEIGLSMPHVRLIAIDTDAETLQKAATGNLRSTLRTQETMHARLQRPSHYLKARDGKLSTDGWLSARLIHRIPANRTTPAFDLSAGLRSSIITA